MMKRIKKFLLGAIAFNSALVPLVAAKCGKIERNYDLGLVSEPINSLNYIKFSSVYKVFRFCHHYWSLWECLTVFSNWFSLT
ncbi:variable surface lipoprotein [Mycoplasmopsis bovis]|uniref:variable surface lipoprotein n=1 Tax=Mycoplasmopsis bovis TaxID=28903 RepID=UPI003D2AF858